MIVDDEPLARKRVISMLESYDIIERCIECKNGGEAHTTLQKDKPDIIFLDIQMPVMNGIEFVETVGIQKLPPIVFITAYDQHAVKAFEYHAVDYLLKPFSKERFQKAFTRVLERIVTEKASERKKRLADYLKNTDVDSVEERTKLFIKDSGLIHTVEISEIDFIQSAGNYVTVHVGKKRYLYRKTMKEMETLLGKQEFFRTHRTFLVNLKKIKTLVPQKSGDHKIILENGSSLLLSRRYRKNLSQFF